MKIEYENIIQPVVTCDCGNKPNFKILYKDSLIILIFKCIKCGKDFRYEGNHMLTMKKIF